MKVFEIAARDARFDFVVAVRAAGGKRRGGCGDAASSGGTRKRLRKSYRASYRTRMLKVWLE